MTEERDEEILSLGADLIPAPFGGDFFDGYSLLVPTRTSLPTLVMPRLNFRLLISPPLRLTFGLQYGQLKFTDIYSTVDSTAPVGSDAYGSFVERFDARVLPVTVGAEYAPIRTQFTTYVGGAVGISVTSVDWHTQTQKESPGSLSRPELNVTGYEPGVVGRVYCGVDYRFDAAVREKGLFRGLYVEASYLTIPVRRDFFIPIRRQARGLPAVPSSDRATLQVGGLALAIGLNLQFARK
jgi:hypothetical protein